jgi:hypothetical protein
MVDDVDVPVRGKLALEVVGFFLLGLIWEMEE